MNSPSQVMKPDVTLSLTLPSRNGINNGLKPEERGIKLIQLLLTCANHASSGNVHRADTCLQQILQLASLSGDSMQRLAARFASALATRLVRRWAGLYRALNNPGQAQIDLDQAWSIFTQAFPYLRFAYTIISRTLIQSMSEDRVIHIIDLGSGDPNLWVPVLRAFGQLPHGPPHLKITCVSTNKSVLDKLGQKLTKEAEVLDMPFQYNPVNVKLSQLNLEMLKIRSGESLAITSVLSLHVLLAEDDRIEAQFGVLNKENGVRNCEQMNKFLAMIRSLSPKVVFLVEQESNHNLTRLVDRFVEGLHYYSAVFDSIDATFSGSSCEERVALEEMFGREIDNIVGHEGLEREERHEKYEKWVVRFNRAGFRPVRLWYEIAEDAKKVVDAYGLEGYMIVNEKGSFMICWHGRPLYSISTWTCFN